MHTVDKTSGGNAFCKVDFKNEPIPKDLSREKLNKEIHVIESNGVVHKNFDAILSILKEYPKMAFIVKLGKLPILHTLLSLFYTCISINRHFIWGPTSRVFWVKITVAIGLILAIVLSSKLWMSSRFYPHFPVIPGIPMIPSTFDYGIFALLVALLLAVIIKPKPTVIIFAFVGLLFFLAFLDQSRVQIFMYQYVFMLIAVGLFSWNYKDTEKASAVLNTCRLIVACVYFWSGLQKLNFAFMFGVFPWFIQPMTELLPQQLQYYANFAGVPIPFFEMAIGIGLLIPKFRIIAILAAIGMHLSILLALGPLGHNWAPVVWPWNLVMITLDCILFWKTTNVSFREIVWVKNFAYQKIVLVLFAIMPLLSFSNLWDSYLSFTMYSGNTNGAYVYIDDALKQKLPPSMQQHLATTSENILSLDVIRWSYDETGVLPYPETRIYKTLAKNICQYANTSSDVTLVVRGKPTWVNSDLQTSYTCADL